MSSMGGYGYLVIVIGIVVVMGLAWGVWDARHPIPGEDPRPYDWSVDGF